MFSTRNQGQKYKKLGYGQQFYYRILVEGNISVPISTKESALYVRKLLILIDFRSFVESEGLQIPCAAAGVLAIKSIAAQCQIDDWQKDFFVSV